MGLSAAIALLQQKSVWVCLLSTRAEDCWGVQADLTLFSISLLGINAALMEIV